MLQETDIQEFDSCLFANDLSGATFDETGKYRYLLFRKWALSKPMVMLIGLNPSTANADKNDNTITKVIKVARNNGYGGVYMLNLFAIVSPHPEILISGIDTIKNNDEYIKKYAAVSAGIVCCWGNFKEATQRAKNVLEILPNELLCFAQNKNGTPKHPLYCKDDTKFINWDKI